LLGEIPVNPPLHCVYSTTFEAKEKDYSVGNQEKEQKERVIKKENTGGKPVLLWDGCLLSHY
jgi:hypothetical protein